jgi:LETM1 and EF-hand domain-containing protein 1
VEEENARMTTEQLKEFGEALSILSAKSSVLQERDELRSLMEENLMAEEVPFLCVVAHCLC